MKRPNDRPTEEEVQNLAFSLALLASCAVELDLEKLEAPVSTWDVSAAFGVRNRDVLELVRTLGRRLVPFRELVLRYQAEVKNMGVRLANTD